MENIGSSKLLKIFMAVAGPIAENNVAKAVSIIRAGGKIPSMVTSHEIRTYYRVMARLKEHGLL